MEDNKKLLDSFEKNEFTCCICGKKFNGFGNNPAPVKQDGECCDDCNNSYVLAARLKVLGL